jgi:RNA polymerase sigma-70 factor, ECF subfamily
VSLDDQNPAAWYARFGASLHRYALMILANRQDSEDAVQQVFARLLRGRAVVKPDAVESYLRTAVRNECFSQLRLRQRRSTESDETLLEAVASEPDSRPDERLALEAALRELPADQREVVHLKAFEGLTFQEIAELTSESINTVASRWRYAMERLRAVLRSRPS